MKKMQRLTYFLLAISIWFQSSAQVAIDADNSNISYWGRIDFTNTKAPAFEFSGVTIRAKFTGTSISAKLHDYAVHGATTTNYYYKIIDGGAPQKFEALAGNNTYTIASGLAAGSHTVELIKLTEASVGKTAFLGFVLNTGESLQTLTAQPTYEIEFIGNSITCGYGNEVSIPANPNTGFNSVNENNYKAWGYKTARNLNMRYRAVSYSGRGMYRNNTGSTTGTLPSIYDRIFPDNGASPQWNHTAKHPNIIVVSLGTNDFAQDPGSPLDSNLFKSTYTSFVQRLKGYHPDAAIICAVGVMMNDYYPVGANHWTRIRSYVKNVVKTSTTTNGLSKIYYHEMTPQVAPYGEDWHPTDATHTTMATSMTNFINSLNLDLTTVTPPAPAKPFAIADWDGDKKAAVVLTFDDWSPGQYPIARAELKSRNMVGTFYVVTRNIAAWNHNWSSAQTLVNEGSEIGNHTFSHPTLNALNSQFSDKTTYPDIATQLKVEIKDNKNTLQQNLTGNKVETFAYPQGVYNQQILDSVLANKHICARGVSSTGNYSYNFANSQSDYYNLSTFPMSGAVSTATFVDELKKVTTGRGLLTYLYHSLDNGTQYNDSWYAQVQQSALKVQFDSLAVRKNKIWITTLAKAIKYHKERKSATLEEVQAPNGTSWILNLTDTLKNNSVYNQPLTIKAKRNGVAYDKIMQNGVTIKIDSSYNDTLMFRAVPDQGQITLSVSSVLNIENAIFQDNINQTNDYTVFPIPTQDYVNINFNQVVESSNATILDINGNELFSQKGVGNQIAGMDLSNLANGVYFLKVAYNEKVRSTKIIILK